MSKAVTAAGITRRSFYLYFFSQRRPEKWVSVHLRCPARIAAEIVGLTFLSSGSSQWILSCHLWVA